MKPRVQGQEPLGKVELTVWDGLVQRAAEGRVGVVQNCPNQTVWELDGAGTGEMMKYTFTSRYPIYRTSYTTNSSRVIHPHRKGFATVLHRCQNSGSHILIFTRVFSVISSAHSFPISSQNSLGECGGTSIEEEEEALWISPVSHVRQQCLTPRRQVPYEYLPSEQIETIPDNLCGCMELHTWP